MASLEFLPAGDAALSRRAKAASEVYAVVVRFSRSRKRYERQGLQWNNRWIPFAYNGSGELTCVDLDPAEEGTAGQDVPRRSGPIRPVYRRA